MASTATTSTSIPSACVPTTLSASGIGLSVGSLAALGPWEIPDHADDPQVPLGADPYPVPHLMAPGIDPLIQARWDVLWAWIVRNKRTRADQTRRLADLGLRVREEHECLDRGIHMPKGLRERIDTLRREAASPFVADEEGRLWACITAGMGLIFVHDRPGRWREARKRSAKLNLFPLGVTVFGDMQEITEATIIDAAMFPQHQLLPWAEAAAAAGYLFALAQTKE